MSERDPLVFLDDILASARKIEEYTKGLSYEDFCRNDMLMDAVHRNFEIIGEATANLDDSFKSKYPSVPWPKMKAMRNMIIHEYFGISNEIVWKAVKENLPGLKEEIQKVIEQEEAK